MCVLWYFYISFACAIVLFCKIYHRQRLQGVMFNDRRSQPWECDGFICGVISFPVINKHVIFDGWSSFILSCSHLLLRVVYVCIAVFFLSLSLCISSVFSQAIVVSSRLLAISEGAFSCINCAYRWISSVVFFFLLLSSWCDNVLLGMSMYALESVV